MKEKQLLFLILVLLILGFGMTAYKIIGLGFSLSPDERTTVWAIETTVTFEADGGPAEVSLNLPDNRKGFVVISVNQENADYAYRLEETGGSIRGVWTAQNVKGPQKIYGRTHVFRRDKTVGDLISITDASKEKIAPLVGEAVTLGKTLVDEVKANGDAPVELAMGLLRIMNLPEVNTNASSLLEMKEEYGGALGLARILLHEADVRSHVVKGVFLNADGNMRKIKGYLVVFDGGQWVLIDPVTTEVLNPSEFLLWQLDDESLLEVTGGSNSKIRFSSVQTDILANQAAISAGLGEERSWFVDFSIYALPIQAQNTFKLLLLIPFGALVVVVMRNLVGVRTSGTFLPILIALTFLQTSLLTGMALFILIVGLGLILRSYLSHLNLLLVPRISAVLVFVIVLYLAISIISHKMGSDVGLLVTFFPMIIISWTIERMSILWEEEGPKEVLIQGGGSLLTASLVYLLLTNNTVGHLTYSFPELLLVVLAIILWIGTYTGYRLSELRRFEPLGRE